MNEQNNSSVKLSIKDEIDFVVLLRKLWKERKTLIIATSCGVVLGLLVAFLSPKEFKVVTTMLPQSESESGLGQFSSLAAMAGFDLSLGSSSAEISPVIFPQIVESAPFMMELLNTPFTFSKVDHPVSIFDYYVNIRKPGIFECLVNYTIGLPGTIKMALKKPVHVDKGSISKNIQSFTEDEDVMMKFMKDRVALTINKKEGYLTLTCMMPEALLTAQVADKAQNLLQKYIIEYKVKSSTEQLKFVEQRYKEKKKDFENAQIKLAWFNDRNQNVSTAMVKAQRERLQTEYDISYSVYSELAKMLEQSKIQVKKQTPVFMIIKPVVVPVEKSKPRRTMILVIFTLVGAVVGAGIVFGKEYWTYYKSEKTKESVNTLQI